MRGGSPGYGVYHVVRALEDLSSTPRGRPGLARDLGLGEAPVKTLIRRLRRHGLASGGQRGNRLTRLGLELLSTIRSLVRVSGPVRDVGWGECVVIHSPAVNPPVDIVSVYRIRDHLVEHGCRDAIIGGVRGGVLELPGVPEDLAREIRARVPSTGEGLVVIVPVDCLERGFEAVLDVIYSRCKPPG